MPHLQLSSLGPFSTMIDDQRLAGFRTKAAQALLVYLTRQRQDAHSSDCYLPGGAPFEEWVLDRREALRRQVLDTLERLTGDALAAAEFETAEGYARRQIEIDDLRKSGHRLLMSVLALSGKQPKTFLASFINHMSQWGSLNKVYQSLHLPT